MRVPPLVAALALAACATPPEPVATDVVLGTSVDAVVVGTPQGQVLEVRVSSPADAKLTTTEPAVEALRFEKVGERTERVGDQVVTTRRYTVQGPPSSYVVEGLCATVEGSSDPPSCAPALYVDVGVKPDRSQMADILAPTPTTPPFPWAITAGVVLVGGGLMAGGLVLWRRRPAPLLEPLADEPPDVLAIRRWESVRDDASLTDEERALALSEIFRAYLEATLDFPARSWTSTETLAHLERLDALPKINVPRAKRLLRATDRVKYAGARPGESFFVDLESDLHAFVEQTRPKRWTAEEGEA
jgi:hypothetical protein